jgi:hypothetical protein
MSDGVVHSTRPLRHVQPVMTQCLMKRVDDWVLLEKYCGSTILLVTSSRCLLFRSLVVRCHHDILYFKLCRAFLVPLGTHCSLEASGSCGTAPHKRLTPF